MFRVASIVTHRRFAQPGQWVQIWDISPATDLIENLPKNRKLSVHWKD